MVHSKTFRMALMAVMVTGCIVKNTAADFWEDVQSSLKKGTAKSIEHLTTDALTGVTKTASTIGKVAGGVVERKAVGALEGFQAVSPQVQQEIARNVAAFDGVGLAKITHFIADAKYRQAKVAKKSSSSYNRWVYVDTINTLMQMINNAKALSQTASGTDLTQVQADAVYVNELARQLQDAGTDVKVIDQLFYSEAIIKDILTQALRGEPVMQATDEKIDSFTDLINRGNTDYNWAVMKSVYESLMQAYDRHTNWLSWIR